MKTAECLNLYDSMPAQHQDALAFFLRLQSSASSRWTPSAPPPTRARESWTLVGNDGRPVIPPEDDDEDGAEWWEN